MRKFWFTGLMFIFFVSANGQVSDTINLNLVEPKAEIDSSNRNFTAADTTLLEAKNFSESQLQQLKQKLDYKEPPTIAESLWERFKRWLKWLFAKLFRDSATTDLGRIIAYLTGVAVVAWLIRALVRANAFRIFFSSQSVNKPLTDVFDENIHEMDFEKLISKATSDHDFRLATRLIFLQALKILSDKHFLTWSPGKTNHEYVNELEDADIKPSLNQLSIYFDYAWYGHFEVSAEKYKEVQHLFRTLRNQIE
ncbi:MAG: DUF4129 domain-containing protein [Bacteroidetes bacterium]|nr:DUF4129 domain-containing protein [Bacteroidota bacterium]